MKRLDLKHHLFYTLRGRLVISIAAVIAIIMSLFITDLLSRQKKIFLQQQTEHAVAFSQALSISAAGWLASYDIAGLQELADAQKRYPELLYTILTDNKGHILAHTDKSKIGQYLLDLPRNGQLTIISQSPELIDVAVPVKLENRQVGWVRSGLNQQIATSQLNDVIAKGLLYIFIAILAGAFIAWLMAHWLTLRLYAVQKTIKEVRTGNKDARIWMKGYDEAAQLAQEFNEMLDVLDERNTELSNSETRFKKLFNVSVIPLVFITREGEILNYNLSFQRSFGYSGEDISNIHDWWQKAYPDPEYRKISIERWDSSIQKAIAEQTDITPSEYNIVCKNGEIRTTLISGAIIDNNLLVAVYDITERKRSEDRLRHSEERFRAIFEKAPIGIALVNPATGKIHEANLRFAIIVNQPVQELLKLNWSDVLHLSDENHALEFSDQLREGKIQSFHLQKKYVQSSGNEVWINITVVAVSAGNNEAPLHLCMVEDITERRKAELKLKEAYERLQKIAARVPGVIFQLRVKPDGRINFPYASNAIKELCGVDPEDAKLDAAKVFERIHPDDYTSVRASIQQSCTDLNVWQHEYRLVHEDGRVSILYGNAMPQKEPDGSVLWHGFISDVTNKKLAEEQLHASQQITHTIINTVSVRVFWKDKDLVYMGCNEMFAKDAGCKHPADVIGKDDFGMSWQKQAELFRKDDRLVLESGQSKLNIEEIVPLADGSHISVLTSKTPLRNSKNEIIGVIGTYIDITDRKLAEIAVNKTNRLYLFVSQINQMIIQTNDELALFEEASRIAVEFGEFRMSWIGRLDEEKKIVVPIVFKGEEKGYLSEIKSISVEEVPQGKGPTGTALRETKVAVCNDIANDPSMAPWRESALKRGYASCIALPLKKSGKAVGVFSLYASTPDFFNVDEVNLLEGVINNLSFALETIETERQRKSAEKRLKDYIFALNESSIVDVSDKNGIIQYANENFCKISGYSLDELVGNDHRILKSGYHSKQHYEKLWATILAGNVWRSEVRNRAKDGSYYWVDTTIIPFLNEAQRPVQFITIRSDITKRKEAESKITEALERYDLLTKASSDTIWDINTKAGTIIYNQGLNRTFGYSISELGVEADWWEAHVHTEDREYVLKALEKAITNQEQFFQFEYRFMCADGTYKYVHDRAFVIYDDNGIPERMIGSMQDITSEKELAIKIEKEVIEAQEREWNQIGMELHDNVNQVLAASLLFMGYSLEKMKNGDLPANEIKESEKYVREAINEIRKLSHQLSPGATKNVSLMHVITSLIDTMKEGNRFHISFETSKLENLKISDKLQLNLYRILQEQLNNIVKHAEANEVTISLSKDGNWLVLRVVDDGKGFDPEKKVRGIGLENIRRRVKAFSGEMRLYSSPGKGCEIIVEIPL